MNTYCTTSIHPYALRFTHSLSHACSASLRRSRHVEYITKTVSSPIASATLCLRTTKG